MTIREWANRGDAAAFPILGSVALVQLIDETRLDLVALIERDFGPLKPSADFERALLEWLHFRARSISRRRRNVSYSTEVHALLGATPAIGKIATELTTGGDISPWLSDSVRKKPNDPKANMMFNDWKIMHFHLGGVFVAPDKISRSPDLLFAYITADEAVFLDVQPHGAWGMQNLLSILLRTCPADMVRFEMRGMIAESLTDDEIVTLRNSGVLVCLQVDGRSFMPPGQGPTTSRHAGRIVMFMDRLIEASREVSGAIEKLSGPPHIVRSLTANLALPVRLGVREQAGQFIYYDKSRRLDLLITAPLE